MFFLNDVMDSVLFLIVAPPHTHTHTVCAAAQSILSARDAQWVGHACVVSGSPYSAINGTYYRAGEANGAPYGKQRNGNVLYFFPLAAQWRVNTSVDAATSKAHCHHMQAIISAKK